MTSGLVTGRTAASGPSPPSARSAATIRPPTVRPVRRASCDGRSRASWRSRRRPPRRGSTRRRRSPAPNSSFSGAPPTSTMYVSRRPFSASVSMTTFMYGIVVVSSADMPRMSGLWSSRAARNLSTSVLMPRSTTSKPAPSSIIATRFLPMSWMSPLTVPITILPIDSAPVSASSGRRISIPAFIALAASSTSGTNKMPSRKSMPTIRMPSTSASFSVRSGLQPRSSRIIVPSTISSARPSYRSSCICLTSSSSSSAARSISSDPASS